MARKSFLLLAALGTSLTACGPVNQGLESVNQPIVSRTNYVFDVAAPEYGGLPATEAARLEAWFVALGVSYGDTVFVDDPQGSADPVRRAAVASVASRYGLVVSDGTPITEGIIPPGSLRVVISRSDAYVPDCPNWRRMSQPEYAASTMSNYGCALNSNLAAMVANPEDLVSGRKGLATNDATTVAKSLGAYRTVDPTGKGGLMSSRTKGQ